MDCAGVPALFNASASARPFITVASMPMLSALGLSMPLAAVFTPEQVAAANHDGDLNTGSVNFGDIGSDPFQRGKINAKRASAHQRLTRAFQ